MFDQIDHINHNTIHLKFFNFFCRRDVKSNFISGVMDDIMAVFHPSKIVISKDENCI